MRLKYSITREYSVIREFYKEKRYYDRLFALASIIHSYKIKNHVPKMCRRAIKEQLSLFRKYSGKSNIQIKKDFSMQRENFAWKYNFHNVLYAEMYKILEINLN